jgi:hypothetical protein
VETSLPTLQRRARARFLKSTGYSSLTALLERPFQRPLLKIILCQYHGNVESLVRRDQNAGRRELSYLTAFEPRLVILDSAGIDSRFMDGTQDDLVFCQVK